MKFRGRVVRRPFGVGSKSERQAVILATGDSDFVLRRQGGNAFSDSVLDELVGSEIEAEGLVHGYTLILKEWRKVLPGEEGAGTGVG